MIIFKPIETVREFRETLVFLVVAVFVTGCVTGYVIANL